MTSISQCFSESYAEARPKFCSAAAAAGGALRSWFNPKARGPNGELLYLDTARFGAADAANMLVLIAEHARRRGPLRLGCGDRLAGNRRAGEAAQGHRRAADPRHQSLRLRLDRRVTEDNVDLNRNFVDHDKAYPKNDGYLAIADAVLPKEWNEASKAATERVFDCLRPEARRLRPARRHQQRPVHPSRRHLLRRQHADLEQPHDPRHRPRGAVGRPVASASSTSTPAWARSATAS